ncbi:diacylglycerol/lipid kinase family protein [Streptomyces cinerochromogenes]|uniref:diacylglycerol/lipid kinase family protein n=1 Tax=Streptomyces cinerochromogenes TaxID=66422 RepID=UPI0019B93A58|nr:diacylglycerol kinase family protein [Streptomyces cinerochromogenes]GGS91493.1 diacylglycerol kinase [Streptomyces cinerochromogenes]
MTENAPRPATGARRPWLIVNPRSGGGKARRFRIAEHARTLGAQVYLIDHSLRQDLATLARRAVDDGADLLGVAGGDGTQALVAEVAAQCGLPFVVIPAGTRNHFAMDLGLDREDPSAALEALTDGVELRVDLGYAGERVFVNNVSFGAYAALVHDPAYRDDKLGTAARVLPEFLARHEGPELVVRTGLLTVHGPDAVLVSNNPYQWDDPVGLGRRAHLDSGLLGVLAARAETPADAARPRGGRPHGLTRLATPDDVVVHADVPVLPAGLDGEAVSLPAPVRCRISPRALRVWVPRPRSDAGRAGRPPGRPAKRWVG